MGGRRRRERVNGERGWRERRLLLSRLSWRSSKVLLIIFKQLLWIFCLCFNIFYLNALSSFFNIALTFVALCMSSYLCCTFLQMAYNSCFLLSMCTRASLSVYAHPRFSSCISVFLSCTLLCSPWILQVFFLFLDFNVVVLFLSFFVKYLQICIFLLKILDICISLHFFLLFLCL